MSEIEGLSSSSRSLAVVRPPSTGHVSDYVIDAFVDSMVSYGAQEIRVNPAVGRAMSRAGVRVRARRRPVVVPMMGARFDLAFAAAVRGAPVLFCWDVWEPHLEMWANKINRLRPLRTFVTALESADALRLMTRVPISHLPEAMDITHYLPGNVLRDRSVDVLELGRRDSAWHDSVTRRLEDAGRRHLYESRPGEIIFPTRFALQTGLADSKISVCQPSSITHPQRSGSTTTMTHRYLESIASGCLILGSSPRELTELLGFDPVVPIDRGDPGGQVLQLLDNIDDYQPVVDRARRAVTEVGSWRSRVGDLLNALGLASGTEPE